MNADYIIWDDGSRGLVDDFFDGKGRDSRTGIGILGAGGIG